MENLYINISKFIDSLPYWAQFISTTLNSTRDLNESDINMAYNYLLEDVGLKTKTNRPRLNFSPLFATSNTPITNIALLKLQSVEGVNALVENQTIDFAPKITIIYGANGSGKTGYIRILKKAFSSRTVEEIVPDIFKNNFKNPKAQFVFLSEGNPYILSYPEDSVKFEFQQFAIFDNKSVSVHLNKRNEFEFRPASLDFFTNLSDAYKKIENRIDFEIKNKLVPKDFVSMFDGESEIKNLIINISSKSKIEEFHKHLPFTVENKEEKRALEIRIAELVALKKDKEITELEHIKKSINELIVSIKKINVCFSHKAYLKIKNVINNYIDKENSLKKEGVENFKTEKIKNIGSLEWKHFIEAADKFAHIQEKESYPTQKDICLLCHQPLSKEACELIQKYWTFIKSEIKFEVNKAKEELEKIITAYNTLNFDLLHEDNIVTRWLTTNHTDILDVFKIKLATQKKLAAIIISDISGRTLKIWEEEQIEQALLDNIMNTVDQQIKGLNEKHPLIEIENLKKKLSYLIHKEKLEQHCDNIFKYIKDLEIIEKLKFVKNRCSTRKITDKEKEISEKFFNKAFINIFNNECKELEANLNIDIKYTGKAGTSLRELQIKGRLPSEILSEGEQKVISLADFLAEIQLSEINKGIVFDDPVNSLDEERKKIIAQRLVSESKKRQVIIFTHDLVFLSSLKGCCENSEIECFCHWMEKSDGKPGKIWLNNTPSYEKDYKTSHKAQEYYKKAKDCGPEEREYTLKNGFSALRTSYEAMVIFDLFKGVVQRFNERVSIDSLGKVNFNSSIIDEIIDGFNNCCRFMEGHSHSDKYAYQKPALNDLDNEIKRFNEIKGKLKKVV